MYRIKFQYYNRSFKRAIESTEYFDSLDEARRRAYDNEWTIVECVQLVDNSLRATQHVSRPAIEPQAPAAA